MAIDGNVRGAYLEVCVFEMCIAQAVAKREQGCIRLVYVVMSRGRFVIIIKGDLSCAAREGHGQFAGRVYISQEGVCNGKASLFTGEPCLQYGRHVGSDPIDGQG